MTFILISKYIMQCFEKSSDNKYIMTTNDSIPMNGPDLCDVWSGQCRDLFIISQWRKMRMPLDLCVRIGTAEVFQIHDNLNHP